MAKTPCSMIALPVHWTAAQTGSYNVGGGPVAVTFVPAGSWTRTFLAPNSGGTSESDPRDLLRLVQAGLNATTPGLWTVRLNSSGYVEIVYNGASPSTGTITFSTAVARALGFASTTVGPIAYSGIATAPMLPAFCWLPYSLDSDDGFRSEFALAMGAALANGQEVVWDEGTQRISRTLRARYAPTSEALRATKGFNATPYWPPTDAPTRFTQPSLVPESCPVGWTVHETISCAPGRRIAYALYDLQELIAGSTSRYFVGGMPLESVRSGQNRARLSISSFTSLVDVPSFELTMTTAESR